MMLSLRSRYCVIKSSSHPDQLFLVGKSSLDGVRAIFKSNIEVTCSVSGAQLRGVTYCHPMDTGRVAKLLPSDHVTSEKGTGLVHVAPAHGVEDFTLAVQHGLEVVQYRCYLHLVKSMKRAFFHLKLVHAGVGSSHKVKSKSFQ